MFTKVYVTIHLSATFIALKYNCTESTCQKHYELTSEQVSQEFYQQYVKNDDSAGYVTTAAHDDTEKDLCLKTTKH